MSCVNNSICGGGWLFLEVVLGFGGDAAAAGGAFQEA